jgi:cytochrome c-type biogenesis protein CcmH/NrfF
VRYFALILLVFGLSSIHAQSETAATSLANQQLANPAQEAIARDLMGRLRCIQCQGQSIADSDAPIAGAMRNEVRKRIAKGESPDAVRQWLISRYGDWVSFEPPMRGSGLLLWILPLLLLLIAAGFARTVFRKDQA